MKRIILTLALLFCLSGCLPQLSDQEAASQKDLSTGLEQGKDHQNMPGIEIGIQNGTEDTTGKIAEYNQQAHFPSETPDELRARIGDLAYEVTQFSATERAFTGEYDNFFEKGLYWKNRDTGSMLSCLMNERDEGTSCMDVASV